MQSDKIWPECFLLNALQNKKKNSSAIQWFPLAFSINTYSKYRILMIVRLLPQKNSHGNIDMRIAWRVSWIMEGLFKLFSYLKSQIDKCLLCKHLQSNIVISFKFGWFRIWLSFIYSVTWLYCTRSEWASVFLKL